MPWWLRVFLVANVVQDVVVGVSGMLLGDRIVLPLEDVSPLNARFIAALYLAGGIAILLAAVLRRALDTRVVLASFGVTTVLGRDRDLRLLGRLHREGRPLRLAGHVHGRSDPDRPGRSTAGSARARARRAFTVPVAASAAGLQ